MGNSKYATHVEHRLIEIEGWARDGLIDEQIAHNLGVSYASFKTYKKQYEELREALKKGKEVVNREVENALLKRALGYRYDEVTQEQVKNSETGELELVVTKVVTKEVAPDTTAQIFWMKNREPEKWRDKKDVEHRGEIKYSNPYENLTEEQLIRLAEME